MFIKWFKIIITSMHSYPVIQNLIAQIKISMIEEKKKIEVKYLAPFFKVLEYEFC